GLDHIVVFRMAAEVTGGEIRLRMFFGVPHAPILAVDINVAIIGARRNAAHGQVRIVAKYITNEAGYAGGLGTAPRILGEGGQVELLKRFCGRIRAKQWIIQFLSAILVAKVKAEG